MRETTKRFLPRLALIWAASIAATSPTYAAGVPPGTPFEALQSQINMLNQNVTQMNSTLSTLAAQSTQTGSAVTSLTTEVDALKAQINALAGQVVDVTSRTTQNSANIATAQSDIATLAAAVASLSSQVQSLTNNMASVLDQLDSSNGKGLHIAIAYPRQLMTLDHAYRPTDPGCQSGFMCSSWQEITGGDLKFLVLTEKTKLLVTFTGNYNWDGGGNPVAGSVFTNSAIDIYPVGGTIPPLQEPSWGLDWRWIPNSGSNASFRKIMTLEPGQYVVRPKHRYEFSNNEVYYFTQWTFFNGVLTLDAVE